MIETVSGYPILTLNWSRQGSDGDLHHLFSYKFAEPRSVTASAPIYKRLFAHLALDELPDAALTEVLDFLGNAWIFYQPMMPENQEPPKSRKGKVTRRYERPTYTIEE
jgi:hypothetical protein